jgi:diguanylate cyclase (GGDEF)-like protein/PAS domain S-box-containing protein
LTDRRPAPRGQLLGFDHVQLAMPAGEEPVRAAEQFYGEVLQLRRVAKPQKAVYPVENLPVAGPQPLEPGTPAGEEGCWFQGPCVSVHLGVEEPFRPARKAHPALLVDDLDAVAERITEAGGETRWNDQIPDVRRFHTDDPFGNRIELVEVRDRPTPAMFEVVAEHSIYPIVMLDYDGIVRWASASIERFFGYLPDAIIGQHFATMISPSSLEAAYEAFASVHDAYEIDPWGGVGVQVGIQHAEGHELNCELAALTTRRSGLPWYVVLVRQAGYERALDQAVEAMAAGASLGKVLSLVVSAVQNMVPKTGVAVCDRWTGERFEVSAGSAAHLLVGHHDAPWAHALRRGDDQYVGDRSGLPEPLAALARAEGYEACWVQPVGVDADQAPTAAIVVWRPEPGAPTTYTQDNLRRAGQLLRLALQWDRNRRTLEFAASHDPLTGLANRQTFRERLTAVARAGEGQAAVLYLDLDHFKPVNDDIGHPTGDLALSIVAQRLRGALRPGDLVARIGGDEFAVLCERLTSPDDVERVAVRLLDAVRQPIGGLAPEEIRLDGSIGVADVRPGETVDAVLARADEAMRAAKQHGRGRWVRQPG